MARISTSPDPINWCFAPYLLYLARFDPDSWHLRRYQRKRDGVGSESPRKTRLIAELSQPPLPDDGLFQQLLQQQARRLSAIPVLSSPEPL